MTIRVEGLHMTYRMAHREIPAVRGVNLEVESGQFYTLLGPSGCGKTTTLRCVAGLEHPNRGRIQVGEEIVYDSSTNLRVPSFDRNIGMVFQSCAIWPHMSVFDNTAFPLRQMRPRPSRGVLRERVMRTLELVKLSDLADRPAPYLSGSQQQRLALARALVREPKILLLDEPLSNLDAKPREEMRFELRELINTLNVTTLFVTHEQIEALTMSDRIGVMQDGIIVQEGTPGSIYNTPDHAFVADFIGRTNFIKGQLATRELRPAGFALVRTPVGTLRVRHTDSLEDGTPVNVAIRPENIEVLSDARPGANTIEGTVEACVFLGNLLDCTIVVKGLAVHVQLHPSAEISQGEKVSIRLPPESCIVIRD